MQPQAKRPVWPWILGGCLILIVGSIAALVGVFYWGTNKLVSVAEEQTKPEARERSAKEILGANTLPPGYHGAFSISMGIVKQARLTDKPDGVGYDKRGFSYREELRTSTSESEDYFAGEKGNVFDESGGPRVRTDEVLRNGELEVNGQRVRYSVRRGEVTESDEAVPSLFTLMLFTCNDDRERWGVLFQREPPGTASADISMTGSVGDEQAIRAFLGHLNVCRAK